ncbi:MAG: hypothetical protein KJ709_01675 [Nanoarchaeota archaeon]|nr:hypothetical protein [Nanoarchaeota archaeon]
MASITLSVSDQFKKELREFPWVNWSEIAREETMKKLVFEKYLHTGEVCDSDWSFCERIDWHPVDELPLKKEYVKELQKARKEKFTRIRSVSDMFK